MQNQFEQYTHGTLESNKIEAKVIYYFLKRLISRLFKESLEEI